MRISLTLAALCLSACATAKGPKIVLVETEPQGALIRVEGFGECQSPCRIEVDTTRNLTIAKAGYNAERIVIDPQSKKVLVRLTLSAPTTDVEEDALPEL